jgi:hypothetical protein
MPWLKALQRRVGLLPLVRLHVVQILRRKFWQGLQPWLGQLLHEVMQIQPEQLRTRAGFRPFGQAVQDAAVWIDQRKFCYNYPFAPACCPRQHQFLGYEGRLGW